MPALGLVASQALVAAVGYALLRALGVAELKASDVKLLGLSYFVGWALMGVLSTFGVMLGIGESLPETLVLAGVVIAVCIRVGMSATRLEEPALVQSREPLAVAVSVLGSALIAVAALSAAAIASRVEWSPTRDFDAVNFWIPKAAVIYWSHGLNAGLWGMFPHPEYPPLAPVMDAMTFLFAGLHPSLLGTQRALLGIAFLFSLVAVLGRLVPRWILLPFVAALATAPWFWVPLGSVMIDSPVAYLVAAAATAGFAWLCERHRAWLVLAWIFLAAAGLTKFEGFFFAVVLAVTIVGAAAVRFGRGALPALSLLLAPGCILVWRFWLSRHGLPTANSTDYHLSDVLDPHFLSERTFRLTRALHAIPREVKSLIGHALSGQYGPAVSGWILALPWLAVLVLAGRRLRVLAAATFVWFFGALGGVALIYWIGRTSIDSYIAVTIERVVPTIVITTAALTTLLLGLELGTREPTSPATAPVPARRSRTLGIAAAAAFALAVAGLADARPAVDRGAKPHAAALARQLVAQFRQELSVAGYDYDLTGTCDDLAPDGLSYACVVSTTGPVGKRRPRILTWNFSVGCRPTGGSGPRCYTNQGEALG